MALIQLIYASTNCGNIGVEEIKDIVAKARHNNQQLEITGFLCANTRYFMQCLEGESEQVKNLFEHIKLDDRHHTVRLISIEENQQRSFPNWAMGVITPIKSHSEALVKHGLNQHFNPYQMNSSECLNLLKALASIKLGAQL